MKIKSSSKLFQWLFLMVNITPLDGVIYFKFEINPFYNKREDLFNKVHFKILGYSFVSRLIWNYGYIPGRIKTILDANMQFGYVVVNKLGQILHREMGIDIEKVKHYQNFTSYNTGVFNLSGEYIGTIVSQWHQARRGRLADRKHAGVYFSPVENKYYGTGPNGDGYGFGIGDKMFDENWEPDFFEIEWEWIEKCCKNYGWTIPQNVDQFLKIATYKDILPFIPFNSRGDVTITNITQAKQSAVRLRDLLYKKINR